MKKILLLLSLPNMKRALLCFIFTLNISLSFGQAPNWQWAKNVAGGNIGSAGNMATDAGGNIYITGVFQGGSATLGSFTLTNTGGADMWIAKFDLNGNVLWAKSAGGSAYDGGDGVVVDSAGNVYVEGITASPSVNFGPITLTNINTYAVFLVKYDPNGNVLWVKSAGDNNAMNGGANGGIAIDTRGNVLITGYFQTSITFGSTTLNGASTDNTFIVKYDGAGNVLWAENPNGGGNIGYDIATDTKGNVYVTGYNYGTTITLGSYTINPIGTANAYVFKLDEAGNVHWAKGFGGTGGVGLYPGETIGEAIAADANGNVYVTGYFTANSIPFGSSTITNTNITGGGNQSDAYFVVKYDSSGNPQWADGGGGLAECGNGIAFDANNNIYVDGYFSSDSITFGSYTFHNTHSGTGNGNCFFVKYSDTGSVLWAYGAGGTVAGNDQASGIVVDNGSIYVDGAFSSDSITFGGNTLVNATPGNYNTYIAKLSSCGLNVSTKTVSSACGDSTGKATATITNGTAPYRYLWTNGDKTAMADSLPSGLYFVTVTDASGCSTTVPATVSDTGGPQITVTSLKNVTCNGESNGSISISVSGGTSPYNYYWDNGAITQNISNLKAGIYQVEVVDTTGNCKANKVIVITQPSPISISVSTGSATCSGNGGGATATVSGGTGSYTYAWSTAPVQTTYSASNLAAGSYTVTVTDGAGCADSSRADVSNSGNSPVVTIDSISMAICSTTDGVVKLSVSGGTSPYTYQWSNGETTSTLVAPSGYYNVKVTDASGCIGTNSAKIQGSVPSGISVCVLTVDTGSKHNIIVWDKTSVSHVDSFKLYYMNYLSVWSLIKAVPFSGPNYIVDNTSINNPNQNTVRYCLTAVDSCGNEEHFASSLWQNTMHINQAPAGTFSWSGTGYLKQGVANPVISYYLYRDSISDGHWKAIDSISGTQNTMSDFIYQAAPTSYPNARWYVAAVLNDSIGGTNCTPPILRPEATNNTTTRSNQQHNITLIPTNATALSTVLPSISVYPNPATEKLNIKFNNTKTQTGMITIVDVTGREVYSELSIVNGELSMNIGNLSAGIYFVRVTSSTSSEVVKFVKL